jgi:plasmid stability protein
MSKMIQLRGVPDALHRQLKARAALEGLSLSEYLTREARKIAQRPSLEEMRERLAARPVTILKRSPTSVVREERDRR